MRFADLSIQGKASTLEPRTLGTRLKAERESRGFTLERISASTKIPVRLLEALERDDLSRWPKGLYRRGLFRSYVTTLGLQPEPLVLEFARVFPDRTIPDAIASEPSRTIAHPADADQPPALRAGDRLASRRRWRSVSLALGEVIVVVAVGGLVAWIAGSGLLTASGGVALVYYPIARTMAGRGRPSPAPSRFAILDTRLGQASRRCLERYRSMAARITTITTDVVARAASRTGQVMELSARTTGRVLMRGGKVAGRALGQGSKSNRVSSRAFDVANQTFWKSVHAAAEYAVLIATRRLNRTRT